MYNAKNIVRITGDCPFVDNGIVDQVISFYKNKWIIVQILILLPFLTD